MPAPPVNLYPDESRTARLRRELRNPSMLTVGIILGVIVLIPLAILGPSWVNTTRDSLESRAQSDSLREQGLLSSEVRVPSQIVPWMLNEIAGMENVTGPASWTKVDFTQGPCFENNLSQLPAGTYADAIATACVNLNDIQSQHVSDCTTVQTCAIPEVAFERLASVRTGLLDAFSDAGFVLPYQEEEQN